MGMSSKSGGVIHIHSAPRVVTKHVEWALSAVLGHSVALHWADQPVLPGTQCAVLAWTGRAGDGSALASALFGWSDVRFEVIEDATPGNDGSRFMHTPDLGIRRIQIDAAGRSVVSEDQLWDIVRHSAAGGVSIESAVADAIGASWDNELDAFRARYADRSVTWLHSVG
jgi:hypothetical protein